MNATTGKLLRIDAIGARTTYAISERNLILTVRGGLVETAARVGCALTF